MGDVWVVRHGQTAWSQTGQHTGRTDVPLTEQGQQQARALKDRLDRPWSLVLTSPLSRASDTAYLAGLHAEPDDALLEWDYGPAEGRTTQEMSAEATSGQWSVWDGPPLGETAEQVGARTRALIERIAPALEDGDVCLVAHGHVLRILSAGWLGLPARDGRLLVLAPAGVGVLGHEHSTRVLLAWNT